MIEHVPSWWPMAGYALGYVMGATSDIRFRFYRKALRRCRTPAPPAGPPQCPPPLNLRRDIRSISYPDPGPDRQPTNPFTGDPVKPQPSGGRLITEGEWRAEWASIDDDGSFSLGLVRDHNPNPPPTNP